MQTVATTAYLADVMSGARHLETKFREALALEEAAMKFLALEELLVEIEKMRSVVIDERDRAAYHANLAGWSYLKLGRAVAKSKAFGQQSVNHGRELEQEE